MRNNDNSIKIAITNLGKYNEGQLVFEWLTLPADASDIRALLENIGINREYEEFFISDFEAPIKIGEYDGLTQLNQIAEELETMDNEEITAFRAYYEEYDDVQYSIDQACHGDYITYEGVNDMGEIAQVMVDDGLFEIDENNPLFRYIDYEAFGRDLGMEGMYVFMGDGVCVQILD